MSAVRSRRGENATARRRERERTIPVSADVRWRTKFLQTLLETEGDVDKAANAAGIAPIIAYQAARKDPDFAEDWDQIRAVVKERRSDTIEASMAARAAEGTPYRRYDRDGNLLEEAREFDTLAGVTILKAYRPKDFRDKPEPGALEGIRTVSDLFRAVAEAERARGGKMLLPEPLALEASKIEPGPIVIPKTEPN
jgi:hypothetical protein